MTDAAAPQTDATAPLQDQAPILARSLTAQSWARFRANTPAVAALWVLAVLFFLALAGPLLWEILTGNGVTELQRDSARLAPTFKGAHIFGTDAQGRDLCARTMFGLRISIAVGLAASAVSVAVGVLWGALAGYVGGVLDAVMMRVVDALYAIPFIFFVILLTVAFGRHLILIFLAIGAVEWLTMARIVRGQTQSLRKREFVEAARASGAGAWRILITHIVPNVAGPLIAYSTINVAGVIMLESFLSFLGLGVQEPFTSLGALISDGAGEIETAWWLLIFPAGAMTILLLSLNIVGDGLRDAFDPKEGRRA